MKHINQYRHKYHKLNFKKATAAAFCTVLPPDPLRVGSVQCVKWATTCPDGTGFLQVKFKEVNYLGKANFRKIVQNSRKAPELSSAANITQRLVSWHLSERERGRGRETAEGVKFTEAEKQTFRRTSMIFWSQTISSLWALADTTRVTLIIGQVMWRLAAFQFTHKKKTCWGDGPSETQHFNFLTSLRPFTNFPTNFCHFEGLYEPCVNTSPPGCFRTSNQWRTQRDKLLNIQLSTKIPDSGLCLDTV